MEEKFGKAEGATEKQKEMSPEEVIERTKGVIAQLSEEERAAFDLVTSDEGRKVHSLAMMVMDMPDELREQVLS